MSKLMVTSFFPAHCSHIFEPYLSPLFEFLYPQDVVELCPEQILKLSFPIATARISIRKPFLALFAIVGIAIGLIGSTCIFYNNKTGLLRRNQPAENTYAANANFYWMISFFFFGTMNLSGLVLHCLLPPTKISPLERPIWWIGDTYSTGTFGMSLWAASMMESIILLISNNKNNNASVYAQIIHWVWLVGNTVGLLSIVWFLIFGYNNVDESNTSMITRLIPGTLPLETWYGGPPVFLASSGLVWMLIETKFNMKLCHTYALSYLVFWIAALDPFLCRKLDNQYLDLFTTPTLFFLATDIIFVGLWMWLEEEENRKNNNNDIVSVKKRT